MTTSDQAHEHAPISGPKRFDGPTALLPPGVLRPFILVTGLFFLWGIPNNLNDVLIRQFLKSFEINRFQASLVQFAFYLGYFVLALPAGILMKRHGYKLGFMTGSLLFASGCFLFLPAANYGKYSFFLAALFIMEADWHFLRRHPTRLAQLGPTSTSEQRLNLSQSFNPLGCITGMLIGTAFIFSGVELLKSKWPRRKPRAIMPPTCTARPCAWSLPISSWDAWHSYGQS